MFELSGFQAFNLGIVTLFLGKWLNSKWSPLREYNIPEPVTGGLIMSILLAIIYFAGGVEIGMNLAPRDALILYFFTAIGLNARLSLLLSGGKPLVILLALTIGYMFVQNLTGLAAATATGQPAAVGVLGGTASFIGGHGTAIAWAPRIAEEHGIPNALEIGVACATIGLILASLMGGPIAKLLINRYSLKADAPDDQPVIGETYDHQPTTQIGYLDVLRALLVLHIAIGFGVATSEGLEEAGLLLPQFVPCLIWGIILTNTVPILFKRMKWPAGEPALALISDLALGVFLSMTLMNLQVWTLAALAGPILVIVVAQFAIAVAFTLFLVFPLMGRNYEAAVICSGFGGISLGATPTAIANMTAVVQRFGAAKRAFIVVPLVCAFFIDLANAFIIPLFLSLGNAGAGGAG
ncbi:MAG: sodium/glutamate symporter [Planctomycetota bacterium]